MESKELKNGKTYRLWLTFPNKKLRDEVKQVFTKDFGSSGLGLTLLALMYARPDLALQVAGISNLNSLAKNGKDNTKEISHLKEEIEKLKNEIKKGKS